MQLLCYLVALIKGEKYYVGYDSHNPDALYQGKVFKSRADFKHQMALYALRNKFRFKTTRSTPDAMVFNCISSACQWRIYGVKLKNVDKYEIRRLVLEHSCSVDDRAGINKEININVTLVSKSL